MSGMDFAEIPMRGLGDNRPPADLPTADALRQSLELKHYEICERANELMGAEQRLPAIHDDENAGKVGDFVKQIMTACKSAEALRVDAKEPYLAASRAVDGFFTKGIVDPLMALKKRVEGKLTTYLRDKAERERQERRRQEDAARAAERAARAAAEEAAHKAETERQLQAAIEAEIEAEVATVERVVAQQAAAAKPAELSRTRGDFGSVASLRVNWKYEIEDAAAIPRDYLMINDSAIKAHIKARIKDKPPSPIPGVRFIEDTSAAVR